MSEYQFNGWIYADFPGANMPFGDAQLMDQDVQTSAPVSLSITAQMLEFTVYDDDLQADTPYAGVIRLGEEIQSTDGTFPVGSRLIAEHVLQTTDTPSITLVMGRLIAPDDKGTGTRFVFSSTALHPGQDLTFGNGGYAARQGQGQNCFARGTLIDTPHGAIPVEQLDDGDEVMNRDGGAQLISWLGSRRLTGLELALIPHLRPVRIMAGALTGGRPGQDLVISMDHRLVVDDWRAAYLFGEDEILVPAKSLLNEQNVVLDCPLGGVEYFHLSMAEHMLVCANGLWAETMLPGQEDQQMLYPEQRTEIRRLASKANGTDCSVLPALPHQCVASIAA